MGYCNPLTRIHAGLAGIAPRILAAKPLPRGHGSEETEAAAVKERFATNDAIRYVLNYATRVSRQGIGSNRPAVSGSRYHSLFVLIITRHTPESLIRNYTTAMGVINAHTS